MHALLEGEVFGRCQRAARREDALYDGVGREVQKHCNTGQRAGFFKAAAEIFRHVLGHAHGAEHHAEVGTLILTQLGLPHDLGGQLVVLHARAGEDGQLLPPDQGGAAVDGGNAGVDAAAGVLAGDGVDGGAVDVPPLLGVDLPQAVDGSARPVKHPAQHLPGQGDVHALAHKVGGGVLQGDAPGSLEHLEHHPVSVDEDHPPIAALPVLQGDLRHLVKGHVLDAPEGDQGAGQLRQADVFQSHVSDSPQSVPRYRLASLTWRRASSMALSYSSNFSWWSLGTSYFILARDSKIPVAFSWDRGMARETMSLAPW